MQKRPRFMVFVGKIDEDQKNIELPNGVVIPAQKERRVKAKSWDIRPFYGLGIQGIVHDLPEHNIPNWGNIWLLFRIPDEVMIRVGRGVVEVPEAILLDFGPPDKIQRKFEMLTGKPYTYDWVIQVGDKDSNQTGGAFSTQRAQESSKQTAGWGSIQVADYYAIQYASGESVQVAGIHSSQRGGIRSVQKAGDGSFQEALENVIQYIHGSGSQRAENFAVQFIIGQEGRQIAGDYSIQSMGPGGFQSAGKASVSIIYGDHGFCRHKGKVLQVMVVFEEGEPVFLTKVINDDKRHFLQAVKKDGKWEIKDETLEEEEND